MLYGLKLHYHTVSISINKSIHLEYIKMTRCQNQKNVDKLTFSYRTHHGLSLFFFFTPSE